ncbi:putative receptor protein kinase ZmPK1 [Rutidosis leptorrhynchoides]|uniref:putative receptor protein kinase ZmPK1 n=1 Tax=Rutidosis leptorrhynchoides TaxID=125765 RepID=UPI003A99AF1E
MHIPFLLLFLLPILIILSSSSIIATNSFSPNILTQGSSLFVEKQNLLVSPNRLFTAGFHQIGQNAYYFAIWFTEPLFDGNQTITWVANREEPVNGKQSNFSLKKNGNLVLTDARREIWTSATTSTSPLQLQLLDSGNLVLTQLNEKSYLWQSFSFPTDTILPNQPFTKDTVLISSKSSTNFSSGFYKLYFDNDNVLRLVYISDEITSIYWPPTWELPYEAGRGTYNNTRIALLDTKGQFLSSDYFTFITTDYGSTHQRKLTLDVDGNIRVYTLNEKRWIVSWQAISFTCTIHGICGPNSLCTYNPEMGRSCSCMKGYKPKNQSDLSLGCEPTFKFDKRLESYEFIKLPSVQFYGFNSFFMRNNTFDECHRKCFNDSNCKAFQYNIESDYVFLCYTYTLLFNGYHKGTGFTTYLKLPKTDVLLYDQKLVKESRLECTSSIVELQRTYAKKSTNGSIKFMLWFSIIFGAIEATCFIFFYYITKRQSGATCQSYLAIATGFRRLTYDEILKVTHKFRDEVGRGGGGVVYKGLLSDNRVVAVKVLHEATQGEAEFLAEMSPIGRINHMNLIETYGYCAEGKHRILVFEYMENGSLAEKLGTNELDWTQMSQIATGVAKGLAYLHEECLEWVLHCDVKPHNILLDADYNPKVADFGLSKLFRQDVLNNSVFSRIRGTRGYMASEWVFNLPITSKVDVYSYGMVVLEMITGRSATCDHMTNDNEGVEQKRLVSLVREKIHEAGGNLIDTKMMEILNPMIGDAYDKGQMKDLLKLALQCVEEDKDERPTMSEVVKILCNREIDD